MSEKTHLYLLWTNADPITADKMVFMYTINSLKHDWWDKVTLVVWGATAQYVNDDDFIQSRIKEAQDAGVYVTACKACADQLGVTEKLEELGIDVQYLGIALTNVLKNNETLLTV